MYKCKYLTDSNIKQMTGSVTYNDVLTYNLRTGRLSSHYYNGQTILPERELQEWLDLTTYNFNRMNMGTGLEPVVLAVKTISCPTITLRGDYANAPHCKTGYGLLGNIIFFDRRRNEYVSTPNKWVYLGSCSCWKENTIFAMRNFIMYLARDKSSTLKKLIKRHR